MAKKPEAKGVKGTKKDGSSSVGKVTTITVGEADHRSSGELMKLPKAEILRNMAIPENKTRFVLDIDNQSKQGKRIISLMENLRDGNVAATGTVTEVLAALSIMATTKPISKK